MDIKLILQARLDSLNSILLQAGKRLSTATIEKIKAAVESLETLLGMDEPSEDAAEQAWKPIGEMLLQAVGDIELMDGSHENLISDMSKALTNNKTLPGDYRYPTFTHPDHVIFRAYSYNSDTSQDGTYRAPWSRGEDGKIAIGEHEPVRMTDAAVSLQSVVEQADLLLQSKPTKKVTKPVEQSERPRGFVLEQAEGEPLLLQVMPGSIKLLQEKSESGAIMFSGIATHGNVINTSDWVYPTALWQSELPRMQDMIAQGKALACFGHPKDDRGLPREPLMSEYCAKFTELTQSGDLFPFKAEALPTSSGKDLAGLLQSGVNLDMSTVASGKLKKGEWEGQPVHIVQEKGFKWHRIADVVLNGASPGSAITDVRLQSLTAEPEKGEGNMTPEELKQAIADAMAAGNTELSAKLQALETKLESLTQSAPVLSDEDKALIQGLKDNAILQAKNAAIETAVEVMIQAKEFAGQFRSSAVTFLQGVCNTAEDIEVKKVVMKTALKPLFDNQSLMQSKGLYVPQYNDDGTTKGKVENGNQYIDNLVQAAVAKEKLVDDGTAFPSNTALSMKKILHNMALEHPNHLQAAMMYQNGDLRKIDDAERLLSQGYDMNALQLMQSGDLTTSDIAASMPFVFPMVINIFPQLTAGLIGHMQPMTLSHGRVYHTKYVDENGNDLSLAANFTGSYANDPGETTAIKELKMTVTSSEVTAAAKKLRYKTSTQVMRHLRTDFGMDAGDLLVNFCAQQIAREWNYDHLSKMLSGATAGNVNYGTLVPSTNVFDAEQWQTQLTNHIVKARGNIFKKTFADTYYIFGDSDSIDRLIALRKAAGGNLTNGKGTYSQGVNIFGTVEEGEVLVKVGWWDTLAPNTLLVVGKGQMWYETGFVIAPYLGLYVTPQWTDPETLQTSQAMLSEVADVMVNGNFFGTVTIQPGVAGTPL